MRRSQGRCFWTWLTALASTLIACPLYSVRYIKVSKARMVGGIVMVRSPSHHSFIHRNRAPADITRRYAS